MLGSFTLTLLPISLGLFALMLVVNLRKNARIKHLEKTILENERLLRLRGNLAAEIAHEIKNPISAILCSAETLDLLIGKDIAQEHRISLGYIKEYGDNLLQLVGDFLDVSMAESGNLKVRPEVITVDDSVRSVIGLLESHAVKHKVKLQHLSTDSKLKILADQKHFKQVIFNLAHNAIRFTAEGGEVQVVVKSDFPEPFVTIAVKDNGVGIPENELSGLFDLYSRYEGNQPKFGTGLGLGLALCKTMVDAAGGEIDVASTVGVGSSFTIRMPIFSTTNESQSPESIVQFDKSQTPLLGQRFLLLDEDKGSRETVARLIEAWGGIVDKVDKVEEALSALSMLNFDAVMIDGISDIADLEQTAKKIKAELNGKQTTVIVSSPGHSDVDLAAKVGADKLISKPFNGNLLLTSLVKSGSYSVRH